MRAELLVAFPHDEIVDTIVDSPDRFVIGRVGEAPVVVVVAPPFVTSARRAAYLERVTMLEGLSFGVLWRIHSYPGRGPRMWRQRIVDGVETRTGVSDEPDLTVEIGFDEFCRFITGERPLREMPTSSTVHGSIGALSSLHWLVEQPQWLRRSPAPVLVR